MRTIVTGSFACLLAAACGGDSSGPSGGQGAGQPTATFRIDLLADPKATVMSGTVLDGPSPATAGWKIEGEGAGCQLKTPKQPFCDPACGSGTKCDVSATCVRDPKGIDGGAIAVKGLQSADITLTQGSVGIYALPPDVVLPSPAAPEGSVVTLSGPGRAVLGAFSVTVPAIAPLVFTEQPALMPNQALTVHWTAPGDPSKSRMQIKIDLSHHGTFVGEIDCDVADSGQTTIPAMLVTKLIQLGTAPNPSITLTRVASASANAGGAIVKLTMESEVAQAVTLP